MASSQTGATHGSPGNNNNPSGERGREKGRKSGARRENHGTRRPSSSSGCIRNWETSRSVGPGCDDCYCSPRGLPSPSPNTLPLLPDFSRQRKSRVFLSRFSKPGEKYIASKEGKTHGYARKLRGGMKKKKKKEITPFICPLPFFTSPT